ncbi:MAG: glycosyltransferase [Chthoniobacterales bacterium]
MEQTPPLVSVLMTVFNAEEYLAASIESICNQTFDDWEFLIVDDASTDRSLQIVEEYALKDQRLRVIRNKINKGQTACLNQGLSEARGKWIARQDADDLSLPTRLEQQIQSVTHHPNLVLVGTCGFIIDAHDRLMGLLDVPLRHEIIYWSAAIANPFLHTSVLFQTDVVRFLGGYDTTYRIAQDYDLWGRLMAAGYDTKNLSERLICYRHVNHSLSKGNQQQTLQEISRVSERLAEETFRETLSHEERVLLQGWRSSQKRTAFWKLYRKLSSFLSQENILIQKDYARFTAALHLNVAGCCSGLALLEELVAAFMADASFFVSWMFQRLFPKNF